MLLIAELYFLLDFTALLRTQLLDVIRKVMELARL